MFIFGIHVLWIFGVCLQAVIIYFMSPISETTPGLIINYIENIISYTNRHALQVICTFKIDLLEVHELFR